MSDPFKIDSPTCISFSGGRTSAYMLWRVLQSNGGLPPEAIVCFANTGKEEEATLEFVRDCGKYWSVPIVWLEYRTGKQFAVVDFDSADRGGQPFAEVIRERNFLPNPVARFCTVEMKILTIVRYLISIGFCGTRAEAEDCQMIGIRADEQRRAAKFPPHKIPLVADGVTIETIDLFWNTQPFNLNLPTYNGKTLAGNCDLCFLKGANQTQTLIAEKPSRADWWAEQERLIGALFRKDRPSYAQMKKNAKQQIDFIGFDESIPCFCGD